MNYILVLGAGRIGTLVAALLKKAKYKVFLIDSLQDIDQKFIKKNRITTVVSCLPYFLTYKVFQLAQANQLNYFDLTEDVVVSQKIKKANKNPYPKAIVPHCGLAPGWVGMIGNHLALNFDRVESIKLRVGGLPQYAHNLLHYAITWSVDGLINQYGNACEAIERGRCITLKPLDDIEELEIDGMLYEAFNTSGGIGNLIDLYKDKVNYLSYKTIRYPGHAKKMQFLMNDLKLNDNRKTLKNILENALPSTTQDVVIVDVSASGYRNGKLYEENFFKKYLPKQIDKKLYSALQMTTATSVCAVIDVVLNNPKKYHGLIYQESISLSDIKKSLFSKYLCEK